MPNDLFLNKKQEKSMIAINHIKKKKFLFNMKIIINQWITKMSQILIKML